MALQTKTLTANGAKGHHKFTLTLTENSTSVANNTSALAWSFVISPIVKDYDWVSNSGKVKWSVTIDGNTYSGIIAKYDGVSTVTIKSSTLTCEHNADGKKTITCSFSITDSTGWSFAPGNASASANVALTTIPRQATITAAPNFNDEQNPTITYSNPAGSAVASLDLCLALDEKITKALAYKAVSKTGTAYIYELSADDREFLQNATPKSNTLKVCFCLRTVIGETEYFSKVWKTLTIVNADPTFDPVIKETNTDIANLTGGAALVRYFSNVSVKSGAKALKGASITSQSFTCGGVTVDGEEGNIEGVQSGDFLFTATDSRDNIVILPVQAAFVAYTGLTCSIGNSRPDTDGNFTLTASGICFPGEITGAGKNSIKVYYQYKVSGGTYCDPIEMSITFDGNSYTAKADLTGLDYRKTYTFQCVAEDLVTTVTTDERPIKAMPVFDWSEEDFNFNVPVSFPGGTLRDFVVEQGESGVWTYKKWASGDVECSANTKVVVPQELTETGSVFYSAPVYVEYPFEITAAQRFTTIANVGILAAQNTESHSTKNAFRLICTNTSMAGKEVVVCMYIRGRWK